ncbi:MAG: nickel-responsive transcriptional regulator NikR [Gammaproteobacteria bacterium]|nr:nickel-responsive transcriptional regulator NikR [Gammaproteobacteria bacterium]
MERFTMSLEDDLAAQFDEFIKEKGYSNRSEAMRDLIRTRIEKERLNSDTQGACVATLSYVYNHHESELASRLTSAHHDHHDLTMSTTHVHLDHDNCLEMVILRGKISDVQQFSDSVMAVRGVRHGSLHMVPVTITEVSHHEHGHSHTHSSPTT